MLSVGQHFKSFQHLFGIVQQHEQESNGAFELTKEKLPNGCCKVSCRCSGPLDEGSGSCLAFIIAEELSSNDVVITFASLQHNHPWLGSVNVVEDPSPEEAALTPPPILQRAEPFDEAASYNMTLVADTASYNIVYHLKQVPRRYSVADGPLDLRPTLIYEHGKYHCPFCENFASPASVIVHTHLKMIHEDPAVITNGEYFVPCYAQCRMDLRRKVNAAHYHCRCGVIFHSVKGITNHARVGFCERFCLDDSTTISDDLAAPRLSERPQRKAKLEAMEIVEKVSKGQTIEFGSPMDQPTSKRRKTISNKKVNEIDLSTVKSEELAGLLSAGKSVNEALLEIFERMQNEEERRQQSDEVVSDIPTEPLNQIIVGNNVECCDFETFSASEPEPGEIHVESDDAEWIPLNRPATMASKKCNVCSTKFVKDSELRSHKSLVHKLERCRWCPSDFSRKDLMAHIQLHHPQSRLVMPVNLLCTLCGVKLEMVEDLALHYRDDHNLNDCDVEYTSFNEATDFYLWKSHMEIDSYSYFVKRRRSFTDNEVTLFFACFYSWGDNRASLKEKKTERHCPAFIKASQVSGSSTTNVAYCLYHVGHELPKERFWKQIQKSLHGLLSFRHKAKSETRRLEAELAVKICQPSSSCASHIEDGEQPSGSSDPSAIFDLDEAMSFYWDTMHDKLTQSGNYTLSIDGRWTNRTPADPDDRLCRICQVEFKNHKSMMRHMLRIHDPKRQGPVSKYSRPVRCLFCNMEMAPPGMKNLIQHYINAHDQQIQLKMRLFRHIDEFNLWREAVTGNVFKRHKFYQSAKGENRQYWTCKFSGKLQNPPAGVTEGHCPAWIFAQTTADGVVQVSYCLYHIGHELNPEPTPVESASAKRIALQQMEDNAQQILVSNLNQPSSSMDGEAPTFAILFGNDIIQLSEGITYQIVEQPQLPSSSMSLSNIEPLRIGTPPQELNILPLDSDPDAAIVEGMESSSIGRGAVNLIVDSIGAPCSSADLTAGSSFDGSSTEETILRHQITVLIRSTTGDVKFVKVALSDFPLVTKDGRKYYALDEASLVEAVSQVMVRQGEHLYEGDQLEILQ